MSKREFPVENLQVGDPKRLIYEFLSKRTLAVLATADGMQPEAAVIEYSVLPNLELIFDTDTSFRKYRNLLSNPRVALAIGWDGNVTVQYEGLAKDLNESELGRYRNTHLEKFPDAIKFEEFIGIKYFKIVPRWIRYTDLGNFPWKRFEVRF